MVAQWKALKIGMSIVHGILKSFLYCIIYIYNTLSLFRSDTFARHLGRKRFLKCARARICDMTGHVFAAKIQTFCDVCARAHITQ